MASTATAIPAQMSAGEWQTRRDLAACYRLVDMFGWSDLINTRITARVPGSHDHFLINPYGLLYEEVTASSLVKIDVAGNKVDPSDCDVNSGGFAIPSAVHMARPELVCVIHTHTIAGCASEDLLAELAAWVAMETPTTDRASVNRLMDVAEGELARAGAALTRIPGRDGYGDNLIARMPREGKPVLVAGHLDTVWSHGTLDDMPYRVNGEKAHGPGIYDMKAGSFLAFHAVRGAADPEPQTCQSPPEGRAMNIRPRPGKLSEPDNSEHPPI